MEKYKFTCVMIGGGKRLIVNGGDDYDDAESL